MRCVREGYLLATGKELPFRGVSVVGNAADLEDVDATVKSLAKTKEADLCVALETLATEHEAAARKQRARQEPKDPHRYEHTGKLRYFLP